MKRSFWAAVTLLALTAASCSDPPAPKGVTTPAVSESTAGTTATEDSGDAAIALFERRTSADSRDYFSATTLAELRLARATQSLDVAEFARAETAASTALAREPGHPEAVVAMARALAGQGRAMDAERSIVALLETQPRNVGGLGVAFDLALAAGRDHAAEAYADRLLAINEDPGTLCRMGQLAERRGDTDGAVTLYRRAAVASPDLGGLPAETAEYRRRAGWTLLRANRPEDAAKEFAIAVAANPRDAEAWRGRAEVRAAAGDTAGAVAAMGKAAAIRGTAEYREQLVAMKLRGGAK